MDKTSLFERTKGAARRLFGAENAPVKRRRRKKKPLPEMQILGLDRRQIYPSGPALNRDFLLEDSLGILDKQTPVASIGSCFAREIKDYLVEREFNYLQTAQGRNARQGSAAWDGVYNTFCLRQEFERALDVFEPVETRWPMADGTLLDPYRKTVRWSDEEHAVRELAEHKASAREALTRARILIMTVGLTEIWYSKVDGHVFFQVPPKDVFDAERHAFRNATVEENAANLERIHELMQVHNPDCHIVVTVSPVPLRATFQDNNVVISNTLSKATLVVATQQFAHGKANVSYFPSYEMVMSITPAPFRPDNRHVRRETVAEIMQLFEANYM